MGSCHFPCDDGGGRCAATEWGPGVPNDHCVACPFVLTQAIVEKNNHDYIIKNSIIYDFRDDFLNNSIRGRQCIANFYQIGYYIKNDITLSIGIEAMNITNNIVIPIIEKILNNPNNTSILYNNRTRDRLINFANEVKALSNETQFISIMNSIIADITYYANKPTSIVVQDFTN